jgi:hypothetical protein
MIFNQSMECAKENREKKNTKENQGGKNEGRHRSVPICIELQQHSKKRRNIWLRGEKTIEAAPPKYGDYTYCLSSNRAERFYDTVHIFSLAKKKKKKAHSSECPPFSFLWSFSPSLSLVNWKNKFPYTHRGRGYIQFVKSAPTRQNFATRRTHFTASHNQNPQNIRDRMTSEKS